MIVLEKSPETSVFSTYEAELRVERTDISFGDVAGDRVRIRVNVHNEGLGRSRPTTMRLESAPFGAFVPWRPLAVLPVPALEPGESLELSTDVPRPRPAPLGVFDRIPPRRLLTAVSSPDQPSAGSGNAVLALLNFVRRGQVLRNPGTRPATRTALLPPDLMELAGRGQPS